jgi:hypothetical protein
MGKRKSTAGGGASKKRKGSSVTYVDGWPVIRGFTMYTEQEIKDGWSVDDYSRRGTLAFEQDPDFRFHLNEKSAGTRHARKKVPPADFDFPLKSFKQGGRMTFLEFLTVWANSDYCRNILNKEMTAETQYLMSNPIDEHEFFQRKSLQWWSWTFMLSLEHAFPEVMDSCAGMSTCLRHMIEHTFNGKIANMSKENIEQYTTLVLSALNGIVQALWHDPTVAAFRPSAPEQFQQDVFKILLDSAAFENAFGPSKKSIMTAHKRIVVHGPLKHVEVAHAKKVQGTQARQRSALVEPRIIEEVDFKTGVLFLYKQAFGKDFGGDDYLSVNITSDAQCAAIMCILQLMCGSRCRGVVGVNWFDRLDDAFDQEYKMSRTEIGTQYEGYKHCILVRRITKEKDQTTREWLDEQAKLARKKVDTGVEETSDSSVVAKHKTIVKPLLFMILDRAYLNRRELDTVGARPLPEVDAVDAFLQLVAKTREYVKRKASVSHKAVEWEVSPLRYEMQGFSEEDTYELKNNQALTLFWNRAMNKLLKQSFGKTFMKKGEGTHILRRLYANRGYEFFGKRNMKETAFTQMTLGHKGFETSLRYTSIIFRPSLPPIREGETLETVTREKIADLESRLKLLEEANSVSLDPSVVPFVVDGGVVDVQKLERLPRAKKGEKTDLSSHLARAQVAADRLMKKGVEITWKNLLKLGVHKDRNVRVNISGLGDE